MATASKTTIPKQLQADLGITPKTAGLLLRLGYLNYRSLHATSPNELIAALGRLPDVNTTTAESYRRAARRMVWLSTQDAPAVLAKQCSDWTRKGLTQRGLWTENYDDMTGDEVKTHTENCARAKQRADSGR